MHAVGVVKLASERLRMRIRFACLVLLAGASAACTMDAFACHDPDDCSLGGVAGLCLEGNCAYGDDSCASGYRYAVGLATSLAGECVAMDDVEGDSDEEPGSTGRPDGTSSSTAHGDATSSDESTEESSTGRNWPTLPMVDTDDASSTSDAPDPSDDASSGSGIDQTSSGNGIVCGDLSCDGCFACVVEPGGECAMLEDSCEAGTDCVASATCMFSCAVKGLCFNDCCGDYDAGDVATAHDLHECRAEACSTACLDLPEPYCSG